MSSASDWTHERSEHWSERAACAGTDVELFFNDHTGNVPNIVKQLCVGCPVKSECLEDAMVHLDVGWRGGMGERARMKLRTQRREAAA